MPEVSEASVDLLRSFPGSASQVWLYGMAEFGYATDDDVPGILADATSRGCQVRVLLLNPGSPGTTAIDGDEGSPTGVLAAWTRAALARFTLMRLGDADPGLR
jgi:hypothetical protein